MQRMYDKQGRPLVPLHLDRNTVIMVPENKATQKYADKYRKMMERSQKIGCHLYIRDDD